MIQQLFIKVLSSLTILVLLYVPSVKTMEHERQPQHTYARQTVNLSPTNYISQVKFIEHRNIATRHINGVLNMYRKAVRLGEQTFSLTTNSVRNDVNASYNHSTRTFTLPYVLTRNGHLYPTCTDQGNVSHESGHMVLFLLRAMVSTSHTDALHEAFGDLTAHFYRFHNPSTRQSFLERLAAGEGCVGDTHFSCTRNSSHPLRLQDVDRDKRFCEPHELSKPFTTAIYGNMMHCYQNRSYLSQWFTWGETEADSIVSWHRFILVKAIISLKIEKPSLMDVAKSMLIVSVEHDLYREQLGRSLIDNGLIVILYKAPNYYYEVNKQYAQLCLGQKR